MEVTVQARIDANFPDEQTMRAFGGIDVLQGECARRLLAEGCAPDTVRFDDAEQGVEQGVWTMQARGSRVSTRSDLCERAEHDECTGCPCLCHET